MNTNKANAGPFKEFFFSWLRPTSNIISYHRGCQLQSYSKDINKVNFDVTIIIHDIFGHIITISFKSDIEI